MLASRFADCGLRSADSIADSTIHNAAIRNPQSAIPLVRHIRNERDLSRALDRSLQLPLVHRARARNAARQNLAALGHEGPDELDVLVVDVVDLVRAELADLAPAEQRASLALLFVAGFLVAGAAAAAAPAAASRASVSERHLTLHP